MGRIISYDSVVGDSLKCIFQEKIFNCGLIVGQCTEQKDIAIRLCPTPAKDEDLQIADVEDNKSKNKEFNVVDLDEEWICQHARQLMRALPGGLDVLGFYVTAPSDYTTKNQTTLRQILFAVFKTLGKTRKLFMCSTERILLTICPVTTKIQTKTYDVSDYKSSANPADWKLQSGWMRWQKVRCQLAVNIKLPIKSEDAGLSLQKQIEIGLHPFLENVVEAYALVNGLQREMDELLDPSLDSKKSKKKGAGDKEAKTSPLNWHDIELFLPLENNNNIGYPEIYNCICVMQFKGAVQCRAYIHSKATVQEAINALKQDIIRSIIARCEIHCEDLLLIEEEQKDPVVVHELPRRVFAPLPQVDLCVCDYQFHSDTAVDSLDAFKELLNLDLSEEDVDTSCEISPTTSTLILPDAAEDGSSEFGDGSSNSTQYKFIPIAGAVITAIVAAISYFVIPLGD